MRLLRCVVLTICLAVSCSSIPQYASTGRAPSYPLAVRAPYSSIWLPANELPGNWPAFWTGTTKGWAGLVRVDGVTYEWLGKIIFPGEAGPSFEVAKQKSAVTTPTQTIFSITAGPVDLNVTFLSPVEYKDVMRQSIPLSYVFVSVASNDGKSHDVQLYTDITGEWATSDTSKLIKWGINESSSLKTWSTELQNPIKFGEFEDYATWGQAVITTTADATHASGSDIEVRSAFINNGILGNTNDENFRCASCEWPTFAFAFDLGSILASAKSVQFSVGHVREENINLMEVPQKALWTEYFNDTTAMIEFFFNDIDHAISFSDALDVKILNDAFAAEGQYYADILCLSLRQAYAGTEFSGTKEFPILYLKEISSNGNMQTVDVMYPAIPMFYYLNVDYLRYLLEPLFYQMENGFWTKPFSIHDIGSHFPNATGHMDGNEEDMPVEESANMLLMVANIVFNPATDQAFAIEYVNKHYPILSSWAEYLYHNCLYPVDQLTTDDFIGPTELNSGLALKGILGMKAFAKFSALIGNTNATTFYNEATSSFIKTWVNESMHEDGTHLKLEYNVTEGYQFKYNAFQDKLLKLDIVPEEIYNLEAAYYLTKEEPYGIPFVSTHDYTKSDWEMWTAAAFGEANPTLRSNIVRSLALYLKFTAQRAPFGDWYVTATANQFGFKSRPVVGGHFSLLALASNNV